MNLSDFDATTALTLRDAIDTGLLNFRGRRATQGMIQKWANYGMRLGRNGPVLILPTLKTGRERLTMRSAERKRIIMGR